MKLDKYMKVSDIWEPIKGFRCRNCSTQARKHPQTNGIWGCLNCGFTTAAIYSFFEKGRPRKETA